eukprot:TRINITY_DN60461_c0_g1_i1.p1 TRINITY_DN60461_c0_g1~~TRINITY_DN60461_c0_g1_i1.p1  ORF type:complete len:373 (+),score=63.84 TRINITY_DN60461_c0_g1_i1:103-1221(+)
MQMANFVTACLSLLLTCVSGLTMQQLPWNPDVSSSILEQPVTLSGNTAGAVTRTAGTSFLENSGRDMFMRTRQAQIQNLLSAEQTALISQEKAIEQIAAQQASLAQQQDELKRQEAMVDAQMGKNLAAFGTILSQTAESSSGGIKAQSRIRRVAEWLQKDWKEQLIIATLWGVIVIFFGAIYAAHFTYGYAQLRTEPLVTREGFSFGLCDGYSCDPDSRICCFSHFCLPIRWADTASSPKIGFITFWTGLFLYTIAAALNSISYGITGLICLVLAVMNRQQIRARYGMPNGTFSTFVADIAVWVCCIPCAAMQEALEVEFVDPRGMGKQNLLTSVMQQSMAGPRLSDASDASLLDQDRFLANERARQQGACC